MSHLIFIRHGATHGNLEKRYIGRTNEPLCDTGVTQIHDLKQELQALGFVPKHVIVSPLLRTRQTAQLLFPDAAYRTAEDFRETDFGILEGKTAEELSSCPAYREWVDSGCSLPIPGGEGIDAFKSRCRLAFSSIMEELPTETTAAFVIHGGVIMAILEGFALPSGNFYEYHLGNGQFISCRFCEGRLWDVTRYDACSHAQKMTRYGL